VRGRGLLAALAAALVLPATAAAAPTPFGLDCSAEKGVRFCGGNGTTERVPTFDGVPLDADVTLPPSGDGPFPTIVMLHGWGGSKTSFETDGPDGNDGQTTHQLYHYNNVWFAQRGYAVLNYSARGFGASCGMPVSSRTPDCQQQVQNGGDQSATGWIHLKDRRREAHDTQHLLGRLVDEGIADPNALGATGISYGGGESFELAYLRDKTQMPDGTFVPWTSPEKKIPLSLKAAWPRWPWSDLVSSLLPNGRFLDFDNSTADKSRTPLGIPIQSYIAGLYALGNTSGWIAPAGADPNADLTTWNARVVAGDPTDDPLSSEIANEIYDFHQGFGCSGCGAPVPLLIQSGWTDDLFPPREALRVYNSVRSSDPNADVALQFGDLGHDRGQNKLHVDDFFNDQGTRFLDKHLKGGTEAPRPGSVTAFTQTCPAGAPAGGPFRAATWHGVHPGAVRFRAADQQLVSSVGGNPETGATIDPIAGGGACATVPNAHDPETAIVDGPKTGGYTMLGLPTVQVDVQVTGEYAQLDSRLWDVAPDGERTLVARGAYRLTSDQTDKRITLQLQGNGWRFAPGHAPQLELLGRDAPYLRPSNEQFSVTVSDVVVEIPTVESPGTGPVVQPTLGGAAGAGQRKPRLRVTVKPRRVRAGKRKRFAVRVRSGKRPVRRALVRFAGKRHRTGRKGRTHFTARFRKVARKRRVVAKKPGYRRGAVRVRVVRKRR
jgi:dienelactone hydrolase